MIRATYNSRTFVYTVRMTQTNVGDAESHLLKFDTGAVATVISIRELFNDISDSQIEAFQELFDNAGIVSQSFRSATGHEMRGYPCVLKNVKLSDESFEWFPFYLITNTDRKVALIGNDFITHCDFDHKADEDILLHRCDNQRLKESFLRLNGNAFEVNQLTR